MYEDKNICGLDEDEWASDKRKTKARAGSWT